MIIDGKKIGLSTPPYIIAELSANHNGSIESALNHIKLAKEAGADAVKIQTYTAETMTLNCDKPDFKITGGLWDGETLFSLYEKAYTPWEWHEKLFDYAKEIGITIFSTPFDETAVDFLESLNAPAYKIASFEMIDLPLIKKIAQTGKPIIMSTGMASLQEIKEAVEHIYSSGGKYLSILHCVSGYPTPESEMNLLRIKMLQKEFPEVNIGLSDHSLTNTAAISSVSLGARVIEKHFIDSRENTGPDSSFSLEPAELASLCRDTKIAFSSLGNGLFDIGKKESENLRFRRSIYFSKDLKEGDVITSNCIRRVRPGFGLAPKYFDQIIGKKATSNISRGTATSWDLIGE